MRNSIGKERAGRKKRLKRRSGNLNRQTGKKPAARMIAGFMWNVLILSPETNRKFIFGLCAPDWETAADHGQALVSQKIPDGAPLDIGVVGPYRSRSDMERDSKRLFAAVDTVDTSNLSLN